MSVWNAYYANRATGWRYRLHIGMILVKRQPSAEIASSQEEPKVLTDTLMRKHSDGPQKSSHNTALVVCLVCLGVSKVCVLCVHVQTQSHISSGISWGLRMPGTDICSLCFSSWAWRSEASLSSRNRSEVSSPANSCRYTEKREYFVTAQPGHCHHSLHLTHTLTLWSALSLCTPDDPYSYTIPQDPFKGQRDSMLSLTPYPFPRYMNSHLHKLLLTDIKQTYLHITKTTYFINHYDDFVSLSQ